MHVSLRLWCADGHPAPLVALRRRAWRQVGKHVGDLQAALPLRAVCRQWAETVALAAEEAELDLAPDGAHASARLIDECDAERRARFFRRCPFVRSLTYHVSPNATLAKVWGACVQPPAPWRVRTPRPGDAGARGRPVHAVNALRVSSRAGSAPRCMSCQRALPATRRHPSRPPHVQPPTRPTHLSLRPCCRRPARACRASSR